MSMEDVVLQTLSRSLMLVDARELLVEVSLAVVAIKLIGFELQDGLAVSNGFVPDAPSIA